MGKNVLFCKIIPKTVFMVRQMNKLYKVKTMPIRFTLSVRMVFQGQSFVIGVQHVYQYRLFPIYKNRFCSTQARKENFLSGIQTPTVGSVAHISTILGRNGMRIECLGYFHGKRIRLVSCT